MIFTFIIGGIIVGLILAIILAPIIMVDDAKKVREIERRIEENPDGGRDLKRELLKVKGGIISDPDKKKAQDLIDTL